MKTVPVSELERLRRTIGMNQSEFAEAIDWPRSELSRWETGDRDAIPLHARVAILSVLSAHLADIVFPGEDTSR